MRVLLIMPPMTQVNAPYPATSFLTGFLRGRGVDAVQADLAIELVDRLFSPSGLERVLAALQTPREARPGPETGFRSSKLYASAPAPRRRGTAVPPAVAFVRAHADRYRATIDPVMRFLRGRDPTLALRLTSRSFLPEGPRFAALEELGGAEETMAWAFGALGQQDQAKYLATLYLADLADAVRDGIDPRFELSRYAEKLAVSAPTFDPLHAALQQPPTLVDQMLEELTAETIRRHAPDLVALTTPFPGNVYAALRIAQAVRRIRPATRIAWGGGYPTTELRELKDPRVFDYVDYVCLDAGEMPLLGLLGIEKLNSTFTRDDGAVRFHPPVTPVPHASTGLPTYDGLPLDRYLSVFDLLNPMHRVWSDGRWNKLMVSYGCYWSQCTFCDTRLDYIERFSKAPAKLLVDRMEALIRETGQTGFHLVDEAAPPALLRALSEEILRRHLTVTWWGNIRFEKSFTRDLCALMAQAGCVAVSGGLEVADDRLLALIRKGVTVEQVARVTRDFTDCGIMVHAYLMYGYPTQTAQETVNSLEMVRQLFAAGCIQSGYWHRFALTAHSPIAADPAAFGIRLLPEPPVTFARNEIPFEDPVGTDHERLGVGLRKAIYNYMHGAGLDRPAHRWFPHRVPPATIAPGFIAGALRAKRGRA